MSWRDEALCVGHEHLFFPDVGTLSRHDRRVMTEKAKSFCEACPVAVECGEYADAKTMPYGVWGGETRQERWGQPIPDDRRCSLDDCDRDYTALGYCKIHWDRLRRYGSPHGGRGRAGRPRTLSAEDLEKVEGLPAVDAAERLGVHPQTLRRTRRALAEAGSLGEVDPVSVKEAS